MSTIPLREMPHKLDVNLLKGRDVTDPSPLDQTVTLVVGEKICEKKFLINTGDIAIRLPLWGNELENVLYRKMMACQV